MKLLVTGGLGFIGSNFILKLLKENNIYYENLGVTQKEFFEIEDEMKISNKELF